MEPQRSNISSRCQRYSQIQVFRIEGQCSFHYITNFYLHSSQSQTYIYFKSTYFYEPMLILLTHNYSFKMFKIFAYFRGYMFYFK